MASTVGESVGRDGFRANTPSETVNQERTVVPFSAPDMCTSCQLFSEILLESSTALSRSSASNSAAFFGDHELKPARGRGFEGGSGDVRGPMICDGRQSSACEEESEEGEESDEEEAAAAVEQAMIMEKHEAMGEEEKHTGTLTEDMEDSRESDGMSPEEVGVGIEVQDADEGGVEEVAAPVDDCGSLVSDWFTAFESRRVLRSASPCCRTSPGAGCSSSSISGSSSVSESCDCVTGAPPCSSSSSSSSASSWRLLPPKTAHHNTHGGSWRTRHPHQQGGVQLLFLFSDLIAASELAAVWWRLSGGAAKHRCRHASSLGGHLVK